MSRRKFAHLLEKYQRGACTPEEKKFVEYWFGLLETTPSEKEKQIDWNGLEEKMWAGMQSSIDVENQRESTASIFKISTFKWLSAASLFLFASYLLLNRTVPGNSFTGKPRLEKGWVIRENHSAQAEKVSLSDGSVVELWPNSSVSFKEQFAVTEREVRLKGKAFFNIKRDTKRPFYVKSGQITTKVLGTSFYVEEGSSAQLPKVEVVTGTVAVYETPKQGSRRVDNILLKANQQATFYSDQHKFLAGLVSKPHLIDSDVNPARFRFRNIPLQQVVDVLKAAYGIEIVIENRNMKTCTLTADLTGQPLYTQLEIICAAVAARYRISNTTIFVEGSGCSEHQS